MNRLRESKEVRKFGGKVDARESSCKIDSMNTNKSRKLFAKRIHSTSAPKIVEIFSICKSQLRSQSNQKKNDELKDILWPDPYSMARANKK